VQPENTQPQVPLLSSSRLIILGLTSLVMTLSIFASAFTALPIAVGVILYGRKLGYLNALFFLIVSGIISVAQTQSLAYFFIYGLGCFIALISAESVLRNVNPIRSILYGGLTLSLIMAGSILGYAMSVGKSVKVLIVELIEVYAKFLRENVYKSTEGINVEESVKNLAQLEQPEKLADLILIDLPGNTLMTCFIVIWITLFILYKLNRISKGEDQKLYTERDIVKFKVPEQYIWILIIGLVFTLWGEQLGQYFPMLGSLILQGLGTFYFFQGFGLYIEFLDFVRLYGILRVLLITLTVFTVGPMLAVLGVFDMFINFRKFLEKKEEL
jgi:MFS family permease